MRLHGLFTHKRILVVEDEMLVAWALEDMLIFLGCEIVGPAVSVNQALSLFRSEMFDAASLDINLNGQKSFIVADEMIKRDAPFFFSTGFNTDSIPDSYKQCPVLQKPYGIQALGFMLSQLLRPGRHSL